MPLLAVEHQMRRDSLPPHEPIALLERWNSSMRVWRCNTAAVRAGVRIGMSATEARAVLPALHVTPHRCEEDRQILETLADWANCLSPIVQPEPPDVLLVDVTGCERLFRGESNLLRLGIEGLAAKGISARGAIADTLGAAWAVAHAGSTPTVVPPGEATAALAPLPPWALRLSRSDAAALDAVGVRKIETLLHLPRSSILTRLGPEVLRRLDQAIGGGPEWLEPYRPPVEPVSRIRFPGATDRVEVIHEALDRLLAFFCEQLVQRRLGVRHVLWTLYHEQAVPTTLEVHLSAATRMAKHLRSLLLARLDASPLAAPTFAMMLWTRATERMGDAQASLFEFGEAGDVEPVAGLLDRLSNRLGAEAVVRPEPVDDHQPERAYRYVPVVGEQRAARAGSASAATETLPRRPLRLLNQPIGVPVMALVPDGPPTWFRWQGSEQTVTHATGPERIETGWWRADDIQRDYFVVSCRTGQEFWLFRDRQTGRWFVHGSFD